MIKFGYTILYVNDVEKMVDFYERTFGFQRKFVTPENDYGEIITGETTLSFASHTLGKSNFTTDYIKSEPGEKPFGFELGFTTDDVESLVKTAIENGGVLVAAAKQKPWGQTVAYIRDPEGFLVEICTPIHNS
ncbi:VOC family protein [Gynurincola endophyticus]|uniref:VOC family protein n=1 Tax=Gynurincola endophyticus TaxID=2479004 RepID=UPI000F8C7883|nr:VOC family protein [Gynurincola endophyticus]